MRDGIEWISSAPDILPLIPRIWMQQAMREHRDNIRWHRAQTNGRHDQSVLIDVGSGNNVVRLLSANGVVGFHHDPMFPRYGYLLIIRPSGFQVTGRGRYLAGGPQPPGTLICFHMQRRLHGLARPNTPIQQVIDSADQWVDGVRIWMALTMESNDLLSPDEAADKMRQSFAFIERMKRSKKVLTPA